jgi:hypothetical protein
VTSQLVKKGDKGLVVDSDKADEAVVEQLNRADALDQYGAMTLFVESWCSEPTYIGALHLVEEFDLPYPRTETELEKQYPAVHQLFDHVAETLTNRVIRQFNAASALTKLGGIYSVGQNHRDFGLQFSASADERAALLHALSSKTAATHPQATAGCVRRALQHLRDIDFGRPDEVIPHLTAALDQLESCGVEAPDVRLALKYFTMDPEKAKSFIYGPSGRGSNRGAIVDLTDQLDALEHRTSTQELRASAPRVIVVGGLRYERVDDDEEVSRIVTAAGKKKKKKKVEKYPGNRNTGDKRTPKNMKGVSQCRAVDKTDDRAPKEQLWCTYDSRGKLRGRHSTKEEAINHKLMLINIFWSWGKGRDKADRPHNKPIHRGKPPKKWGRGKK